MDLTELDNLVQQYIDTSSDKPFLKHLDYFKDDEGNITTTSIGKAWHALDPNKSTIKTRIKGLAIILGANYMPKKEGISSCPFMRKFSSSEQMMINLKHPCDTQIVNTDGSININKLKELICRCAEYDYRRKKWHIRKQNLDKYIQECINRDKETSKTKWYLPSFEKIVHGEWNDFYEIYSDFSIFNTETASYDLSVTVETLLDFYFKSDELNSYTINFAKIY